MKKLVCIRGYDGRINEGEICRYSVNRLTGKITVRSDNGWKVTYPTWDRLSQNFKELEL